MDFGDGCSGGAPTGSCNQSSSAAAELDLKAIVSKRAASRYRSGPSRSWLKTKNMVESNFILLGIKRDSDACPGRCRHQIGMAGLSTLAQPS